MRLTSMARRLWALLLVDAVVVTALAVATGTPLRDTILQPARAFARGEQTWDSWRPMQTALAYLDAPHVVPVYDEILVARQIKFQYPLTSLLFTDHARFGTLNVVSWLSVVVLGVSVWLILLSAARGTSLETTWRDLPTLLAVAGLTLTCYPVMKAYALGQIQAWINVLLALAALAWIRRRDGLSGICIGLACLMKPTYLLLALWGAARRRWSFVVAIGIVSGVGLLAALVLFGVADNLDYLRALKTMSTGEAFRANQSFNGLLNRWMGNGNSLVFERNGFAPYQPFVFFGTIAAFIGLGALAWRRPRRTGGAGSSIDLAIATLTITMTSPIAWDHHYGVVLPILAAAAPAIAAMGGGEDERGRSPRRRHLAWWALVGYVFISQSILSADRLAGTPLSVLQSSVLIGACLLLAALYGALPGTASAKAAASIQ